MSVFRRAASRAMGRGRNVSAYKRYDSASRHGGDQRTNFGKPFLERAEKTQEQRLIAYLSDDDFSLVNTRATIAPDHILQEDPPLATLIDTFLYCGEHLVLGLLEYIDAERKMASRFCECYSFRKSSKGDVLVYCWSHRDDPGGIRSYRFDRVISLTPTILPYRPRYTVELFTS